MTTPARRFFVPAGALRARNVTLSGPLAHRLSRVLRLKRGDHVLLTSGGKREYDVQLTGVSPHAVTGVIVAEREAPQEPGVTLVLYQSLIRPNRFDLVLEKGTEIGVSRFVPLIAARSQSQMEEPSATRAQRWERIVIEAAEQSGRGCAPLVEAPVTLEEALGNAPGLRIMPYEEESELGLTAYLRGLAQRPATVSLFIGPEGGFEPAEVEFAREQGVTPVTLGPRVMRSETAGIVASALALDALGQMNR